MHAFLEAIRGMATTRRHAELCAGISAEVLVKHRSDLYGKKPSMQVLGDFALVYYGNLPVQFIRLVELAEVDSDFVEIMNELEYIQPDFMIFQKNPCMYNKRQTRIAGRPDLIVEVWSSSDTPAKREFKQLLYASSPVTEHWYIDQDSNMIKCFMGEHRLPDQSLVNVLKTRNGIFIDLTYLAL